MNLKSYQFGLAAWFLICVVGSAFMTVDSTWPLVIKNSWPVIISIELMSIWLIWGVISGNLPSAAVLLFEQNSVRMDGSTSQRRIGVERNDLRHLRFNTLACLVLSSLFLNFIFMLTPSMNELRWWSLGIWFASSWILLYTTYMYECYRYIKRARRRRESYRQLDMFRRQSAGIELDQNWKSDAMTVLQ